MAATLKCINCGGDLQFKPTLQLWKCEWCDKEYTEQDLQGFTQEADEALNTTVETVSRREETDNGVVVNYKCSYCGAEVVTSEETAATFCVYCQRPVNILSQLSGEFKPSVVLPFKNTKADALEQFKNYLKGKRFVPKSFSADKNLDKLTGVYVPFWLYDGTVNFDVAGEADIVTNTRSGDYNIKKTDTYKVARKGQIGFANVPVDASVKTPDDVMDSIEPYDFAGLKPFATPYLSGFIAERFDVSQDDSFARSKKRMLGSAENKIRASLSKYSTVRRSKDDKQTENVSSRYGLLPVWMLHSSFEGKDYIFAMNGQTGRMTGDLPVDKGRAAGFGTKIFLISGIIGALLGLAINFFVYA